MRQCKGITASIVPEGPVKGTGNPN